MKKLIIYLVLLLMVAGACKKYDEGPWMSLRTKEKRLCQEWEIDKYLLNSEDTSFFKEQNWTFKKNGDFLIYINYGSTEAQGEYFWRWADNKENIEVKIIENKSKSNFLFQQLNKNKKADDWTKFQIKKLKFDQLVLEIREGENDIRIEFVKK